MGWSMEAIDAAQMGHQATLMGATSQPRGAHGGVEEALPQPKGRHERVKGCHRRSQEGLL